MSNDSYEKPNSNLLKTPGQLLREQRLTLAIDARKASDFLKITCSKLEAIEADNYGIFSSSIYVRGHLRNYARLVNISEAEIMDCYYAYVDNSACADSSSQLSSQVTKNKVGKKRIAVPNVLRSMPWWWPYSLVVGVALLWIVIYPFVNNEAQQQTAIDTPVIFDDKTIEAAIGQTANNITDNDTVSNAINSSHISSKSTSGEERANNDSRQNAAIVNSISGAAGVMPVIQDSTVPSVKAEEITTQPDIETTNSLPASTVKMDQLVLSFTDDCWLEVTDAEGRVLATKLHRAGDQLMLRGNAPFNIMLGNVKAAEVRLNGKEIALTPLGDRRTLRFTLGNT